jgi:SAM-dependent methyltransferase
MYGQDYMQFLSAEENLGGSTGVAYVARWLKQRGRGTFIDYGCGAGHLLILATSLGWKSMGVEFDSKVAEGFATSNGRIVTDVHELKNYPKADLLHLGDVIEHLTEPESQIPEILSLVKPGAVVIAQGPLEANANLFTFAIDACRALRPKRTRQMAPYHVVQATAFGQRQFFRRFGLKEIEFSLSETAWPAPERLSFADLHPREVALYLLRRASQGVSALRPDTLGNRYLYAGRLDGNSAKLR